MGTLKIGPFNASVTTMGPMRGILIPKEFTESKEFKALLNVKKHKITVLVDKID